MAGSGFRVALLLAACSIASFLPGLSSAGAEADGSEPAGAETADAQAAAPPVEDLVREALARSPSVAALKARVEAARAMARVPGLPNPMLEVMTQDVGFPKWTVGKEEMSMVQLGVTQSFPPFGRTGAQRAAGRADAEVRGAELEAARRQVASQVRSAYARIYALDQERAALESGGTLLHALSGAARERYSAAKTDQEAVLKAQIASTRLDERRYDLETERQSEVAMLNELLGRPGNAPLGLVASLPEAPAPASGWDSLAVLRSPQVLVKRSAVRAAEERVRVARSGFWPELSAGGDVGLRGSDLDKVVTFRLGVGLPLWETARTKHEVEAAQAELLMAQEEQREAETAARAAAARLGAEWRRSAEQVRLYREALLPQSQAVLEAAQASFLSDRVDFSTVVEDFQMWLEARAQLAARESERFTTWAEMESLLVPAPPDSAEASPASGGGR